MILEHINTKIQLEQIYTLIILQGGEEVPHDNIEVRMNERDDYSIKRMNDQIIIYATVLETGNYLIFDGTGQIISPPSEPLIYKQTVEPLSLSDMEIIYPNASAEDQITLETIQLKQPTE